MRLPALSLWLLVSAINSVVWAQQARNIQISSDGLIVATQISGGLLVQRGDTDPVLVPLPASVANLDDISLTEDGQLLFAMSTSSLAACSYSRDGDSFDLVGCQSPGFLVQPFSGISARDNVCIISGGTLGFTVLEYEEGTGIISPTPRTLNRRLPNVIGHPDVQLASGNLAALSTDFADSSSGNPRFGTMMVDLNTGDEVRNFRVADSLGFDLFIGDTNFPLVSAFYKDDQGKTFMYTANGGMTVQDPFQAGTTQVIASPSLPGGQFRAVTLSVDQDDGMLVVGGLVNESQSVVVQYDIAQDPLVPISLSTTEVSGRISSVGANGGVIAYVAIDLDMVGLVNSPSMAPTTPTAASTPTGTPATRAPLEPGSAAEPTRAPATATPVTRAPVISAAAPVSTSTGPPTSAASASAKWICIVSAMVVIASSFSYI